MYKRSIEDPAGFWSDIASQFFWKQPWNASSVFSENLDVRNGPVHIQVSRLFCVLFLNINYFPLNHKETHK